MKKEVNTVSELKEFFVVTETSLYRATDDRDSLGVPIVEKVEARIPSKIRSGETLGLKYDGKFVGIRDVLCLFTPSENFQRPENSIAGRVATGSHSSPITALFLDENQAKECLDSGDGAPYAERWESETREVLEAIGANHDTFVLSAELLSKVQGKEQVSELDMPMPPSA